MSIFSFNTSIITEQLLPPLLRKVKFLAWLKVLVAPIQNKWSLIFEDFKNGNPYTDYLILNSYIRGDRVRYEDNAIYECILNASSGNTPLNSAYWVKVNDTFIGVDERLSYNSQTIILEHSLNKWFRNESATDQIYITTHQIINTVFQMGNNGRYSSTMSNLGGTTWMGNDPSYTTQYNFTVYIPTALFLTLGTDTANRENNIRGFVDKYNLAGIKYNVTTY